MNIQSKTSHKIIHGDSRKMALLPDESVHLIITSPPYWQLKDYGTNEQIGFHENYESYINNLNFVWKECYRVLHSGCRLCINIGDQFARAVYYGRYKVIPIRTEIIKFCETLGFDYMGAIIWQKVTTCNTTGGATIMGSYPYPRNGILKIDYEFILVFKKLGKAPKVTKQQKKQSKISKKDWNMYFSGHWQFPGASQTEHLAVFPEELPARLIKMFSFVEETVLDPFLGSGTTSLAARNLGRNSVGYEINPDYIPIIKDKLAVHQQDLTGTEYEFLKDTSELRSRFLREEIGKLPYIFTDPHKFDKKVDPKKMQFGSQITGNEMRSKENFFSVKDVLSPTLLRLDNDLVVRLLGVREKETTYDRAVEFLRKKTKSEKVFLKYDRQKYDGDNHLLCYLYLKNKTFINARIIKEGLADVDVSYDFKYKDKLIKLGDRNGKRVDFK